MSEEIKVHFTNYIGTKCVNVFPMSKETYCKLRGWYVPADEDALEEGYLVEYPDSKSNHPQFRGYISWSPKSAFEEAYRDTKKGCTFGHALELLKSGYKLARKGWNGKGMFLFMVSGGAWDFECDIHGVDGLHTLPFICMKTADDKLVPWLASQSDVLAEDWVIL